jgi:DNA transformation protein and related proteins
VDPDFIQELFAAFGPVSVRRLFGGAGLYAEGVLIGAVFRDEIYLKADAETAPRFDAEGCGTFEYATSTGTRAIASFRMLPERLYDDADELADWARQALGVARRKAASKQKAAAKRKSAAKRQPARKAPATRSSGRSGKRR